MLWYITLSVFTRIPNPYMVLSAQCVVCVQNARTDSTLMLIARDTYSKKHVRVEFGATAVPIIAAVVDRKPVGALHVLLIPMRCTGMNVDNLLRKDLPMLREMMRAAAYILAHNESSASYVGFHLPPHTSEDTLHCHVVARDTPVALDGFTRADVFCRIERVVHCLEMFSQGACSEMRHAEYRRALRLESATVCV